MGIQTLLGEAIGLALLSPTPVPHEVIPLQVTRGLKHTKRVPSDHLEGAYSYCAGWGGRSQRYQVTIKMLLFMPTPVCVPWEGRPCLESLVVSVTPQRLQCFQLG